MDKDVSPRSPWCSSESPTGKMSNENHRCGTNRLGYELRLSVLRRWSLWRILVASISCSFLLTTGCMVGPDFWRPSSPRLQDAYVASTEEQTLQTDDLSYWWTQFEDDTLNALITRACRQNLDLWEAYYRVVEARAQIGVVSSRLYPQVEGDGSYSFRQTSRNASEFVPLSTQGFDLFGLGFDSTWEIDLFGKLRRAVEASYADLRAENFALRDIKVILLADIATSYTQIRILQKRIAIAEKNLAIQKATRDTVQERLDAGLARPLDLAQATSNVHITAASIPPLREALQVSFNQLSVLVGGVPSREFIEEIGVGPIPIYRGILGVGLPGELLRRRPDIRQAEQEVAAASARIGVATADLYPRFTITGDVSVDSRKLSSLFTSESLAYNVGPSFRWNILTFGRVRSNIDVQQARHRQTIVAYRQRILLAVQEVENGLVGFRQERERFREVDRAFHAIEETVRLSRSEWASGLTSFLSVFDAERNLLVSEEQLALSEGTVILNVIRTYKALGGGWDANCCLEIQSAQEEISTPEGETTEELTAPDKEAA